ncbi:MAG: YbjN domain-containing protein [Ruminococcus flavefaciens]|nr:YbjN domain-containing protein [Ruminococcus flavefaciens]MCM1380757.1 YbjN domain-containing protein [Muribaculaceae bacterium]MCM1479395.1 YbjN domain-containing protein [Muribaculaceae bacterium]
MFNTSYSKQIAAAIEKWLTSDDWHYYFDKKKGIFKFDVVQNNVIKKVLFTIKVKESDYLVYAVSPIGVDTGNRKAMSAMIEFINRANYGMRNGNFEFDIRDGEIRYKCYVDCSGTVPTNKIIRNSICFPASTIDKYAPGIADIIFYEKTASDAIRKCEGDLDENLSDIMELFDSDDDLIVSTLTERFGTASDGEQQETSKDNSNDESINMNLFSASGGAD